MIRKLTIIPAVCLLLMSASCGCSICEFVFDAWANGLESDRHDQAVDAEIDDPIATLPVQPEP